MAADRRRQGSRSDSSHTTIYHALEDKIQKRHATGYLRPSQHDGSTPSSRHAASPRAALAARIGSTASRLPCPSPSLPLPSSDLLNALHGFTSRLYASESPHALKSLDESALLALGVITEVLVRGAATTTTIHDGDDDNDESMSHLLLQATPRSLAREQGIFTPADALTVDRPN